MDESKYDETTVRLVTELIHKTGSDETVVEIDSFTRFLKHLNPNAYIPTVEDIREESNRLLFISPRSCIVCGVSDSEETEEAIVLPLEHAALVLLTTVLVMGRDKAEAAQLLHENDRKCCIIHFGRIFRLIFESLGIQDSKDFNTTAIDLKQKWFEMFLYLMKNPNEPKQESYDVSQFISLLEEFKVKYEPDSQVVEDLPDEQHNSMNETANPNELITPKEEYEDSQLIEKEIKKEEIDTNEYGVSE